MERDVPYLEFVLSKGLIMYDVEDEEDLKPAKKKKGKEERVSKVITTAQDMFMYKKLDFLLFRDMLATTTGSVSIWTEHIIQKSRKEIKAANFMEKKIAKAHARYIGENISEMKELAEYKAIIRSLRQTVKEIPEYDEELANREVPNDMDEVLAYGKELQEFIDAAIKRGETQKKTVFMLEELDEVDEKGNKKTWPVISSHMVLGNLKENLRNIINNSPKEKSIYTKVSCGEIMAGDIKPIEEFLKPSIDLKRDANGKALVCERPLHFDLKGVRMSAIAMSEVIPAGAIFSCHLRIRRESPIVGMLMELLHMGKNNGLGAWRGSGGKGAYYFRLSDCTYEDAEKIPKGWN